MNQDAYSLGACTGQIVNEQQEVMLDSTEISMIGWTWMFTSNECQWQIRKDDSRE